MKASRSSSLFVGLLLLTVGSLNCLADYSELENLAYIDKILKLLNNNLECELPTYDEVDEMQKSFVELEQLFGSELEWRLSDDQKLARRTILDQWSSFQQRMTNAVVIRSAKKRSFICKVEEYQKAKFGESVCARIKDVKGPITDRIFEKNPIVRYIKHIETGDVPERPVVEPATTTTTTTTTASAPEPTEPVTEASETTTTEAPIESIELVTEPEPEPTTTTTTTTTEPTTTTEVNSMNVEEPDANTVEVNLPAHENQPDANGVVHRLIGHFTIDYPNGPKKIVIQIEPDENHDPLDDIPVPSSNDNDDDLAPNENYQPVTTTTTTTTTEAPPTTTEVVTIELTSTEATATTTRRSSVQFDEFGAELIDADFDDADLERLVRAPPKDWAFDPIFGYFKWPDEVQPSFLKNNQNIESSRPTTGSSSAETSIQAQWANFTADPEAYDAYLDSLRAPKLTQAELRLRKKQFLKSLANEGRFHRQQEQFGWIGETSAPERDPLAPVIKSDRWTRLADNNLCKIDYNRDYIPNAGKRGFKAVKSFFSSSKDHHHHHHHHHNADGITRKRRLISQRQ